MDLDEWAFCYQSSKTGRFAYLSCRSWEGADS
jgi:hypothetical protein